LIALLAGYEESLVTKVTKKPALVVGILSMSTVSAFKALRALEDVTATEEDTATEAVPNMPYR